MRTYVYIDGLNLFYGILKGTPYKWLDIKSLCEKLLPEECDIQAINYYTAMMRGSPEKVERQLVYLEALRNHIPEFKYILGRHQNIPKLLPRAIPAGYDKHGNPKYKPGNKILVLKSEEKKSDVNLAVDMLDDAWRKKYDCAVLISNDSDLAPALYATRRLHKRIGLATTTIKPTGNLQKLCDFHRHITNHLVKSSQLPDEIEIVGKDPKQYITKPDAW